WFRLIPKGEATKLARVQIDFPNSLDELWTIDIKKSRARPPRQVRERLRQIISRISGRSTNLHRKRGVRLYQETQAPVWERYADENSVRYAVNPSHPVIQEFSGRLSHEQKRSFSLVLEMIAVSLNLEMIYSDYSTHPRLMEHGSLSDEQVKEKLLIFKNILNDGREISREQFIEIARISGIFDRHIEIVEQFASREFS
ncbi:MAG: ATP-binding protein, partial [Candidatus Competibacteraceae bacterium]|nr:ATP-binding protein [Candidatus Competibacteraceae bacterium]